MPNDPLALEEDNLCAHPDKITHHGVTAGRKAQKCFHGFAGMDLIHIHQFHLTHAHVNLLARCSHEAAYRAVSAAHWTDSPSLRRTQ